MDMKAMATTQQKTKVKFSIHNKRINEGTLLTPSGNCTNISSHIKNN